MSGLWKGVNDMNSMNCVNGVNLVKVKGYKGVRLLETRASRNFSPDFTIITLLVIEIGPTPGPHSYKLRFVDYGSHKDARSLRL